MTRARKKVLIPTKLDKVASTILTEHGGYEVIQEVTDLSALAAKHPETYALIVRSEKVTKDIISALPALRVIIRAGAGYNTIDTKHARVRGIDVMTTPGANSNAVAEEVVAMMLADARHIVKADASCRAGGWEKTAFMGREVTGKTVGIVGLGNIGRLVAKRLAGFEVKVIGYDPVVSSDRASEVGVELKDIETVFAEADYISLHIPENDQTKGMISEALLAKMKTGATLINCARSGILDENALRKLKVSKKIRFLNDVYAKDEEGPKSCADIADLMLPHLGASTFEANANAARRAAEELIEFDEQGVTSFIVNRDIPEGLDEAYCRLMNMLAKMCKSLSPADSKLKQVETTMYGALTKYADWLIVPFVAAIDPDFDRASDAKAALKHLAENGIDYHNRDSDSAKGYGEAITVDCIISEKGGRMERISVRGTVAESTPMVSRINEFDKLYFEPSGITVYFLYDDRPGVLGAIGVAMAEDGINIEDVRNPHDPKTNRSLAIMRISSQVPADKLDKIAKAIKAIAAFQMKI